MWTPARDAVWGIGDLIARLLLLIVSLISIPPRPPYGLGVAEGFALGEDIALQPPHQLRAHAGDISNSDSRSQTWPATIGKRRDVTINCRRPPTARSRASSGANT